MTPQNRGPGPDDTQTRNVLLQVRLTHEQRASYAAAAQREGDLDVSSWARRHLNDAAASGQWILSHDGTNEVWISMRHVASVTGHRDGSVVELVSGRRMVVKLSVHELCGTGTPSIAARGPGRWLSIDWLDAVDTLHRAGWTRADMAELCVPLFLFFREQPARSLAEVAAKLREVRATSGLALSDPRTLDLIGQLELDSALSDAFITLAARFSSGDSAAFNAVLGTYVWMVGDERNLTRDEMQHELDSLIAAKQIDSSTSLESTLRPSLDAIAIVAAFDAAEDRKQP